MVNMILPLRSLWKTMKNKYQLDYIMKCQNFTSGKFHGSWFRSLFLLKSWFHVHFKNDQKIQNFDEETDSTIALMATRVVKSI